MITRKLKRLSVAAALVATTAAFSADTIKDAFANGKVSGNITAYGISSDNKGGTKDSGFSAGTASLSYETDSVKGFSAKLGYIAGTDFSEIEKGDASSFANDSLMTEIYLKYADDNFAVIAGRQEIDLEWLGDYNEAVVGVLTAIPDTTIVAGYVDRQAAADEDEIGTFARVNGTKGAYVVDAKYAGVEGLEVNPYYYSAPDLADFYGIKATYATDMFGIVGQYAKSSEDTQADGDIGHIEVSTELVGLSLAAGYITTDKTVGAGSISALGDNLSPFDNGANTYSANADTIYASVSSEIAGIGLGALYGETDFGTSSKESELNLTADYSISEELALGLLYVDYDLDASASSDYNSISATLTYSF